MARLRLRFVHAFIDRRGGGAKARYYFRRIGFKQVPLPGLFGSAEFMETYRAALAGQERMPIGAKRVKPGTLGHLIVTYLSSPDFLDTAPATRSTYRAILDRFRGEHGNKPVVMLSRQHITAMLAKKIDKPAAANHWLRLVKVLMGVAVAEGLRRDNPAAGIRPLKNRSEGFHTWSEEEITAFENRHPIGSRARLALALLLYTAQRRSDVVRMGRQHVRGNVVQVRQQKTGAMMAIPLHPDLAKILDATPSQHLTFLTTEYGKPFSAAGFGNWFRDRCNEAGLSKRCAAHGLRKAACRRLAEAGCSANEIASISGHLSLREVERYTKAASQERMARNALAAMVEAFPGTKDRTSSGNGA